MSAAFAFLFPGQGSQSVGMLSALAADYPLIEATYQEASAILGYDLWALSLQGPETQLNETRFTQPAILTGSIALWRIWRAAHGKTPVFLAGHSLGEYSALVAAEALSFTDAVRLVAKRGELMQQAVTHGEGAMAAVIGLPDEDVKSICAAAAQGQVLSAANFNAPGQVVIAGDTDAVARALQLVKEQGKRAILLPVSVPSHCLLMQSAAEKLQKELAQIIIQTPQIPVFNNADVEAYEAPEAIKHALIKQLYSPVRWVETIQTLTHKGCHTFVECGPGKVLTGLNKRIVSEAVTYPLCEPELLTTALSL